MISSQKHLFAIFFSHLKQFLVNNANVVTIEDPEIIHRIIFILRLEIGQALVVFDQEQQCLVQVEGYKKNKFIILAIKERKNNLLLLPKITFLLPLLKKESFENALYSLTELGANEVQLVISTKSQTRWSIKEFERAQKIIIAAAEQSKNFRFPTLHSPIPLSSLGEYLNKKNNFFKYYFDPDGKSFVHYLPDFKENQEYLLMVGPEGDLLAEEKKLLQTFDFHFCKLTPTILRSWQAVTLSMGIFRTLL